MRVAANTTNMTLSGRVATPVAVDSSRRLRRDLRFCFPKGTRPDSMRPLSYRLLKIRSDGTHVSVISKLIMIPTAANIPNVLTGLINDVANDANPTAVVKLVMDTGPVNSCLLYTSRCV